LPVAVFELLLLSAVEGSTLAEVVGGVNVVDRSIPAGSTVPEPAVAANNLSLEVVTSLSTSVATPSAPKELKKPRHMLSKSDCVQVTVVAVEVHLSNMPRTVPAVCPWKSGRGFWSAGAVLPPFLALANLSRTAVRVWVLVINLQVFRHVSIRLLQVPDFILNTGPVVNNELDVAAQPKQNIPPLNLTAALKQV